MNPDIQKLINETEAFIRHSLSEEQLAIAVYLDRKQKMLKYADKAKEQGDEELAKKFETMAYTFEDILAEEEVHVGQFREMLDLFNVSDTKEDEGEQEGEEDIEKLMSGNVENAEMDLEQKIDTEENFINLLNKLNYLTEQKVDIKVKHPGILEIPEGKKFWQLPLSHYNNLIAKKGYGKIIKALTNRNGFVDENGEKVYAGTTLIKHTNFANSGISAISLDTLPQGSFLETNITTVFKMLLGAYMSDAYPENMALTSFPTLVEIGEGVNFYDWKNVNQLTYESLVGQDIRTLIASHGGLGSGFEVNITEEDYLPLKKLLLDNHANELLKEEMINIPFYFEGGGYNESDLIINEELAQSLSSLIELDPFTYSLDLKAMHSDHFDSDPQAKYETMKVAMLRASFNVIGFNNYKMYGLKANDGKWFNESPSLEYLRNYES